MCEVNNSQSAQFLQAVVKEEKEVDLDELALNSEEIKVGKMTLRVRVKSSNLNDSVTNNRPPKVSMTKNKSKSVFKSGKRKYGSVSHSRRGIEAKNTADSKNKNKNSTKASKTLGPRSNNLVTKLKDLLCEFCESNCEICNELICKLSKHVKVSSESSDHDAIQDNLTDPLANFDDLMDFQDDNLNIKVENPHYDEIIPSVPDPDRDRDPDSPREKRKKRGRGQDISAINQLMTQLANDIVSQTENLEEHDQPHDDLDPRKAKASQKSLWDYSRKRKWKPKGRRGQAARIKCPLCVKKYFTYKEDLEQHLKSHSTYNSQAAATEEDERRKRLEKEIMDKAFQLVGGTDGGGHGQTQDQMHAHAQDETQKNPIIPCKICTAKFRSVECLKKHYADVHDPNIVTFTCPECGSQFRSTRALSKHFKVDHPTAPKLSYKCSICNLEFEMMCYLKEHVEKVHCSKEEMEKSRPFKCQVPRCGESFKVKVRFDDHMKFKHTPDGGSPFSCPACGKVCRTKRLLRSHRLTHNPVKRFMCDVCSKCFRNNPDLTRHSVTHTGERSHVCDKCGKAFGLKSVLDTHYKSHTGYRPHKCEICGKGFMFRGGLKSHMVSHAHN